ncbi:MAG: hypothetical protein IJB49_09720 [Clostridia bacterium]|nr:hypothetical protein [Clostridia bacterium]
MEFFAAANSRNGFVSTFETTFSNVSRLYILKGSSGCGKSTFMRRVASEAQKLGMETDLICCSSDPDSLDGVIVRELGVAVADGTAPHTMDVKYPCVRESIINLGQFWNESRLLPHSEKIISLTDRKSNHYKNAYRCLAALGTVNDMITELISRALDRKQLETWAFRFTEKLSGKSASLYKELFCSAFGASGLKTKAVFGSVNTLYRVNGRGAHSLLFAIWQIAREKNISVIASRDPIDPSLVDALMFVESGVLITLRSNPPCSSFSEEKKISTSRFTDASRLAAVRSRLRLLDRTAIELSEEAKAELAAAKELHNTIESIYIPAMDFSAVDEYTESFCRRVIAKRE